jgi:hypothetical protein
VKDPISGSVVAAAPTLGPAIVSLFGIDIPVLALGLSITALLLARWIAPPPIRKLSREQQWALTFLLLIFLFLAVTGELPIVGDGTPMGPGMAVVWGAGLGFSGLLVIELMGHRVMKALEAMFGSSNYPKE